MLWIPLIALLATIVKSATGFGLALVVVGFGALAIGPEHAIPLAAVLDLVSGAVLMRQTRHDDRPAIWRPMAASMGVGAVLGSVLFTLVDADRLTTALGATIVASAVALFAVQHPFTSGPRTGLRPWVAVPVSAFGGVLAGLVGPGGPPVIIAASTAYDKTAFRALLAPVFLAAGMVRTVAYVLLGAMTTTVVTAALLSLLVLPLGAFLGARLHRVASTRVFDAAVVVLLVLAGVRLMV